LLACTGAEAAEAAEEVGYRFWVSIEFIECIKEQHDGTFDRDLLSDKLEYRHKISVRPDVSHSRFFCLASVNDYLFDRWIPLA
jgi:hypothetical protein